MGKQIPLLGVSLNGTGIPSVAPYTPPLGVKGYTVRRKSSEFQALGDGQFIPGWTNPLDGSTMARVGTPSKSTLGGRPSINCVSAASAALTEPTGPLFGTFFIVCSPYGGPSANTNIMTIGGRQVMRRSDTTWALRGINDTQQAISITNTTFPYTNDQLMIVVATLTQDGRQDNLRLVGGGRDVQTEGPTNPTPLLGVTLGKTSGATGVGYQYVEDVRYPNVVLSGAERNSIVAALKLAYGIA